MKSIALLFFVGFMSIRCYSQNSHEVRLYYGAVTSEFLGEALDGSAGYDNKNTYEFGVRYLKKVWNKLYLETGVNFLSSEVQITPAYTGVPVESRNESLKLISIPLYANYSLGKYFFVNGGPIIDFQNQERSFDSQSGIGYGFGAGLKYNLKNILFYVNPNFQRHSFIPFEKENNHQKLTEAGIQFGLGYTF